MFYWNPYRFGYLLHVYGILSGFTFAKLVNVTVDDQNGDPTTSELIQYSNGWSFGPSCEGCQALPDSQQAYMGAWHDDSYGLGPEGNTIPPDNATFIFTGKYSAKGLISIQ